MKNPCSNTRLILLIKKNINYPTNNINMSDQNSDEIFPNSQLLEVNCGIKFPTFLKISDKIKDYLMGFIGIGSGN